MYSDLEYMSNIYFDISQYVFNISQKFSSNFRLNNVFSSFLIIISRLSVRVTRIYLPSLIVFRSSRLAVFFFFIIKTFLNTVYNTILSLLEPSKKVYL